MSATAHVTSLWFKLVRVVYRAKSPPHFLDNLHLLERHIQGVGSGPYRVDDSLARSVCGNPCLLARRARRFGCESRLLTVDTRRLSGVAEPLSFLSDCLERLAMMIANLTRFLGQPPELFRLIPGHLSGHAIVRNTAARRILVSVPHEITLGGLDAACHRKRYTRHFDEFAQVRPGLRQRRGHESSAGIP
jgi:hypothetical protein